MSKSSTKCIINIYLRQSANFLSHKHPSQRKKEHPPTIRVSLQSAHSNKKVSLASLKQHPYLNNNILKKTPTLKNPQKSFSKQGSLRQSQSVWSSKLHIQKVKVEQLKKTNRTKQAQAKRNRSIKRNGQIKSRLQTKQSRMEMQQFQYKYQQRQREQEVKLRRKTSQRSFIVETHKQSIDMLKKSRQIRSRSQMKLAKEKYFETERNHEYQMMRRKTAKLQQNYQITYQKAFIKNQPFKASKYPNLAITLAISAKTIAAPSTRVKNIPKIKEKIKQQPTTKKETPQISSPNPQNQATRITQIQFKNPEMPNLKAEQVEKPMSNDQESKKLEQVQAKPLQQQLKLQESDSGVIGGALGVKVQNQDINLKNS